MKLFIFDTTNLKISKKEKSNYYFDKDKRLNHGSKLIKEYLLIYLGYNKDDFILEKTINGKPFYKSKKSCQIINFNISHDENKVVLFYNDNQNVGIDIMNIKQRKFSFDNIINNYTPEERLLIKNSKDYNTQFYKIWTLKEAYFKYLGIGILNLEDINYTKLKNNKSNISIDNLDFKIISFFNKDYYNFVEILYFDYIIMLCFNNNNFEYQINVIEIR